MSITVISPLPLPPFANHICPEQNLRSTQFQDTRYSQQMTYTYPQKLLDNPSVPHIFTVSDDLAFEQYIRRATDPILVMIYSSTNPVHMKIIHEWLPQVRGGGAFLLVDVITLPKVAAKYMLGRPSYEPILVKMFRGVVKRFYTSPWSIHNLCTFVNSLNHFAWRNENYAP